MTVTDQETNRPPEQQSELLLRVAFYAPSRAKGDDDKFTWVPGWEPDKRTLTWPAMVSGFSRFRTVLDKVHTMGWSPGVPRGTRRKNDQVDEVSCLVLDVDDGADFRVVSGRFFGFALVAHSTWRHTSDAPRGRIILPLAAPIPVRWWPRAFFWAQATSGCAMDPACKDPSRTYYLPSTDGKRECLSWAEDGKFLDLRPFADLPLTPQEVESEEAKRILATRMPRAHWRPGSPDDNRKRHYAERVLENRCAEVAAVKASRHNALCIAAVTIGGYVGGGYLEEQPSIEALAQAGIAAGLPPGEARRVSSDMVKAGIRRPLHPPR